ncbi:YkgJ family cysteine cluster protein [Thiocapsa rosea]|uniref:Putative zinc-or iron-chelating protein n=1 Tax=Thiocapsa rosea TaxID=69360 RepID=A0A495VFU5_9GAMM|nr:YkgJ family cysteine cluster protein [Thiocapsa rosea]RKT47710.1 putative zinc- or iron-chelating protein [Thiocapsa rosea]
MTQSCRAGGAEVGLTFVGDDSNPTPAAPITCETCAASCCRLEVWCLTDTGVPGHLTVTDHFGRTLMDRLDDGWCAALDRDTMLCRIYAQRPLVCRELEVGSPECLAERG